MDKKQQLLEQIKLVINNLQINHVNEINSGILQLLYKRYKDALEILENNKDVEGINISGGVRAYMDGYNNYQHPLLGELHKAEKLFKEL
ncbi:hypothetical protein MKY37_08600 [Psychrobacillus sp. FSL K6-2836]|uniref:hypothetical protein n=1 Tax=Psychrobacillus sp. FSL K6-2836 TaxID=2921548 RepID=UPI0030FC7DC2